MSDTDNNHEDVQVEVLESTVDKAEALKGYHFEPRRSRPYQMLALGFTSVGPTGLPQARHRTCRRECQ